MYDIDTKNVRKVNKFYFIFLAASLLFLVVLEESFLSIH